MPDARCYVVRHDRSWFVKFEDEEFGPYETQDEAMRLAVGTAALLERSGETAKVHLLGDAVAKHRRRGH